MTRRKYNKPITEHKLYIKYNKSTTALSRQCTINEAKSIDYENTRFFAPQTNTQKAKMRESMEIITR